MFKSLSGLAFSLVTVGLGYLMFSPGVNTLSIDSASSEADATDLEYMVQTKWTLASGCNVKQCWEP